MSLFIEVESVEKGCKVIVNLDTIIEIAPLLDGGSSFLSLRIEVRNRVYLLGTHAGSFVLVGLQKVVPKWFQRWFRFGRWFQVVPFGVVPTR